MASNGRGDFPVKYGVGIGSVCDESGELTTMDKWVCHSRIENGQECAGIRHRQDRLSRILPF